MRHLIFWYKFRNVSEESGASIFEVEDKPRSQKKESCKQSKEQTPTKEQD
jgi:hypothetical protein